MPEGDEQGGREALGPSLSGRAARDPERLAVVDGDARAHVHELLAASDRIAAGLLAGADDLEGARVPFLVRPGADFVAAWWGIWRAGGVAVPIATSWPVPEIERLLADADARLALADEIHLARLEGCDPGVRPDLRSIASLRESPRCELPSIDPARPALMIYTSGTTGRPKGVVTTHANLAAQVDALLAAWGWRPDDRILHVLPLHHVHGLVNALACPLAIGATCEFCEFDPPRVWERLASGEVTVFMAVPTIYRRLLEGWSAAPRATRERWSRGAAALRLMVSGSAALPVDTLERWEGITGHRLLERYGMTEIGMALANPLAGERRAGTVGQPLPGVQARLVDESGEPVAPGEQGEIEVRGPQVFAEYWRRPDETAAAFRDGWFRTGDMAIVDDGYWRILGRASVDIVKTGGYKVSALEIEEALRSHADVADAAVVGVPDPAWGERLCAAVVAAAGATPDPDAIRAWCKERLAPYKVPKVVAVVSELPRNAMGKVQKPALRDRFAGEEP